MEETSKPQTRKKSGWFTDPHDHIEGEAWGKNRELAIDHRSPGCKTRGNHQALTLVILSIAARQAQSHHLAFKFSSVHAASRWLSASDSLNMSRRSEPDGAPALYIRRPTKTIREAIHRSYQRSTYSAHNSTIELSSAEQKVLLATLKPARSRSDQLPLPQIMSCPLAIQRHKPILSPRHQ